MDRAALDAAFELAIPCGGWCPQGRMAEDGVIPARYLLAETPERQYAQRTEWNVRDSDGTLIVNKGELSGGSLLTFRKAQAFGKPCFVVQLDHPLLDETIESWLGEHSIQVLNIAGPRESSVPHIYQETKGFLVNLFQRLH